MVRFMCVAFAAFAPGSAVADFVEERTFEQPGEGIERMKIVAGPGNLEVIGDEDAKDVTIQATIRVDDLSGADAAAFVAEYVQLHFEIRSGTLTFTSEVNNPGILRSIFGEGGSASVDLVVHMPRAWPLRVEDGSGDIRIDQLRAGVSVEDGSGDIEISSVAGGADIDDSSGDTTLRRIRGPVVVVDGSGDILVTDVRGEITIDDGSGTVEIRDVVGTITIDDGSGHIVVENVEGDVRIEDAGSGGVTLKDITGATTGDF